jgi:hypothetical protein
MAGQTAHLVELIDIVLQLTEALGLPAIYCGNRHNPLNTFARQALYVQTSSNSSSNSRAKFLARPAGAITP